MKRGLLFVTIGTLAGVGAIGMNTGTANAGVTPMTYDFTYQGRLDIAGVPFNGTAQLRFTLWDSLLGGAIAPAPAPVNNVIAGVSVIEGVFTVTLNFGASAFAGDQRYLNIEVDTTLPYGDAYTLLTPRRLITSTPYAAFALGVNGATITGLNATNIASGTINNARTTGTAANAANTLVLRGAGGAFSAGPITATLFTGDGSGLTNLNVGGGGLSGIVPIANGGTSSSTAAGALSNLSSGELQVVGGAVGVGSGAPVNSGTLNIFNGAIAQESLELVGSAHRISTYGSDGLEQIRLWGPTFGEIQLHDNTDNNITVLLTATNNEGGFLSLRGPTGLETTLLGNDVLGGSLELDSNTGVNTVLLRNDSLGGGRLYTRDETGLNTSLLGSSTAAGGFLYLYQANGSTLGMDVDGDATGAGGGANLNMRQANGVTGVNLDADASNANGGGVITVSQADASTGVIVDGDFTNANGGGAVSVNNNASAVRVRLDGESVGTGGEISVFDATGTETVEILGAESTTTGGQIILRDAAGNTEITLDGEFGAAGDPGRITTPVLQITGGADLSEQFDIASTLADLTPEPGMVVCIDPEKPGHLLVSGKAYDRCVAGIISGAGGIRPGMLMGQRGSEADGKLPVALTGRVYVRVSETNGSIQPGDLLTTSDEAGKAMKVTDFVKAQGAIIGKAMTRMDPKTGMVLVLVGLQ